MKVLVINCGSSSIKYELFEMPEERVLAKGQVEELEDHAEGLRRIVETLTDPALGGIEDIAEIGAVGHRVVHAGEAFARTVRITDEVVSALEDHVALAPLHNPPNLLGIRVAREVFPGVVQVGVFDTAFHQTMPPRAYVYPVPYELYTEHRVRRYGFHGTSHRYVAERAAEMLGKPLEETNLISAHLGNGASITAIEAGKSVDTSMGLTPLEGLVMGTRCGDIDPALMPYLARVTGSSLEEIDRIFNKKSGVLGLSGISNDMRTVVRAAREGNERAELAIEIYCYRLKKYVGAYTAVLGRVDALIFTGGVGENQAPVRERTASNLDRLGFVLDPEKNDAARAVEADIATPDSPARILVVPTNEELKIARDTFAVAAD